MSIHYFWLSSSNLSIIGLAYVSLIVKSPKLICADFIRGNHLFQRHQRPIFKSDFLTHLLRFPTARETPACERSGRTRSYRCGASLYLRRRQNLLHRLLHRPETCCHPDHLSRHPPAWLAQRRPSQPAATNTNHRADHPESEIPHGRTRMSSYRISLET